MRNIGKDEIRDERIRMIIIALFYNMDNNTRQELFMKFKMTEASFWRRLKECFKEVDIETGDYSH